MHRHEWIYDQKGQPRMNLKPKTFEELTDELLLGRVWVKVSDDDA